MNKKQYKNSDYIIYEDGRCYSNKSHKFLTPKMSVKYPTYSLTLDGSRKNIKVHRMVAETFIPNPDNKPIVNHLDGDTHNYHITNLEWATSSENSRHAISTGLQIQNDQTAILLKENIIIGESWTNLPEYDNYIISDKGRIANKNTNRLKKTPLDNNGYPHVNLWKNNKGKTYQVHRLMYQAFNPTENLDGYVINHIDGDKTNNVLSNLEKIIYQENNLHAEYVIKSHQCGKMVAQMTKDGEVIATYASIAEAQRLTGYSNISRAISKHYFTQGYYWKFI